MWVCGTLCAQKIGRKIGHKTLDRKTYFEKKLKSLLRVVSSKIDDACVVRTGSKEM